MKRFIAAFILLFMGSVVFSLPVSAETLQETVIDTEEELNVDSSTISGGVIYIKTQQAPEHVNDYAIDMFENYFPSLSNIGIGGSNAGSGEYYLAPAIHAHILDPDVQTDNVYYYPVMNSEGMTQLLTVSFSYNEESDEYSYGITCGSTKTLTDALCSVATSYDNPAEIYVSPNFYCAVTGDGIMILEEIFLDDNPYTRADREKWEEAALSYYAEGFGEDDVIIACGDYETGFVTFGDSICYIEENGVFASGWKTVDGKTYCFKQTGEAVTGTALIGDICYRFDSEGVCEGLYSGWIKRSGGSSYCKNGKILKNCILTRSNGERIGYLDNEGFLRD